MKSFVALNKKKTKKESNHPKPSASVRRCQFEFVTSREKSSISLVDILRLATNGSQISK